MQGHCCMAGTTCPQANLVYSAWLLTSSSILCTCSRSVQCCLCLVEVLFKVSNMIISLKLVLLTAQPGSNDQRICVHMLLLNFAKDSFCYMHCGMSGVERMWVMWLLLPRSLHYECCLLQAAHVPCSHASLEFCFHALLQSPEHACSALQLHTIRSNSTVKCSITCGN